jgi:phenylalanyl-tRNA synthetase alpha chain
MALQDFLQKLDDLASSAAEAFSGAQDAEGLEAARVEYLGAKSGRLKAIQKQMADVPKQDKPAAGKRLNEVKSQLQEAFEAARKRLETEPTKLSLRTSTGTRSAAAISVTTFFDTTLPGTPLRLGRLHPLTQTIEELKDIMGRLGFSVAEGPEIEDEWHNFEALNIPPEHPARDPLENFYLHAAQSQAPGGDTLLLRSQTSTVQIRVMERTQPPVRIISLGRVYRPDTPDDTHYPMFHQIEGLLVDRQVTMADLKSTLRMFAASYLGADVHIRFRPSFFPFTEPSVEADFSWNGQWIEFGGAGMVDPNVLQAVGYDPEQTSGFAFGLGIERLCMRRHGVSDIREFYTGDVRFLRQF